MKKYQIILTVELKEDGFECKVNQKTIGKDSLTQQEKNVIRNFSFNLQDCFNETSKQMGTVYDYKAVSDDVNKQAKQ